MGLVHLALDRDALEGSLDGRTGGWCRIVDREFVFSGFGEFNVPRNTVGGARPVREIRAIRGTPAAFDSTVRQPVAGWQKSRRRIADREWSIIRPYVGSYLCKPFLSGCAKPLSLFGKFLGGIGVLAGIILDIEQLPLGVETEALGSNAELKLAAGLAQREQHAVFPFDLLSE